ncbi:YoaK family protein [Gordonia sp. NPDC003425]
MPTASASSDRLLAFTLLAAAGFLDAIAFTVLGGSFVAFMSGNTTILGQSVGTGHWHPAALAGALIACFFLGNVLGNVITRWGGPRRHLVQTSTTAASAALGSLVATTASPTAGLILVAISGGMINTTLSRSSDIHVGLTYVTGTLVKAAQQLVYGIRTDTPWQWVGTLFAWLVFAGGATAGGIGYRTLGLSAMWIAVAGLVVAIALPRRPD